MRRALCVGIDEYGFGSLNGCVNDAQRMRSVLEKQHDGSPNFDCRILVAPQGSAANVVTRTVLRDHLQQLFKDPPMLLCFTFQDMAP